MLLAARHLLKMGHSTPPPWMLCDRHSKMQAQKARRPYKAYKGKLKDPQYSQNAEMSLNIGYQAVSFKQHFSIQRLEPVTVCVFINDCESASTIKVNYVSEEHGCRPESG